MKLVTRLAPEDKANLVSEIEDIIWQHDHELMTAAEKIADMVEIMLVGALGHGDK